MPYQRQHSHSTAALLGKPPAPSAQPRSSITRRFDALTSSDVRQPHASAALIRAAQSAGLQLGLANQQMTHDLNMSRQPAISQLWPAHSAVEWSSYGSAHPAL